MQNDDIDFNDSSKGANRLPKNVLLMKKEVVSQGDLNDSIVFLRKEGDKSQIGIGNKSPRSVRSVNPQKVPE